MALLLRTALAITMMAAPQGIFAKTTTIGDLLHLEFAAGAQARSGTEPTSSLIKIVHDIEALTIGLDGSRGHVTTYVFAVRYHTVSLLRVDRSGPSALDLELLKRLIEYRRDKAHHYFLANSAAYRKQALAPAPELMPLLGTPEAIRDYEHQRSQLIADAHDMKSEFKRLPEIQLIDLILKDLDPKGIRRGCDLAFLPVR